MTEDSVRRSLWSKLGRWRCPSCGRWTQDPMAKRCSSCRLALGEEVITVSTDIEGEQYYRDIKALDPENRVELMLDMIYAVEKALDDMEATIGDDLTDKNDPRRKIYRHIDDALEATDKLYQLLKNLNREEAIGGKKEKG